MSESCWVYSVVSSKLQSDTREDQERWARTAARRNGWEVTRTFGTQDDKGISSGKDGVRKLLQDLLEELERTPKARRPERILMRRLDRVGREALDSIAVLARIRRLKVLIHTEDDGDLDLGDITKTIMPIMKLITAEIDNGIRSQNWRRKHAERRAAGLFQGSVPFGVVLVAGRATPYEPEAAVVKELFQHAEEGWGYTRLARWAREQAPHKRQRDGSDRVLSWAPSTIKSILNSKTIRGLIIDEEQWQRVHATRQLDFRARSPKRWPWPLLGAIRCLCGKALSGHCGGNPPYHYRYYICRWHETPDGGRHPAHRADALEASFVGLLKRFVGQPDVYLMPKPKGLASLQAREKELRRRLNDLDRRRHRIWALAEEGTLSGMQLRERLDEIDIDRQRAKTDLKVAEDATTAARTARASIESLKTAVEGFAKLWPLGDVAQQQQIARAVAALPTVGGLWAHPENRGFLMPGCDVAKLRKNDDAITKKFIQSITEG